jgi:hypothetical protein
MAPFSVLVQVLNAITENHYLHQNEIEASVFMLKEIITASTVSAIQEWNKMLHRLIDMTRGLHVVRAQWLRLA